MKTVLTYLLSLALLVLALALWSIDLWLPPDEMLSSDTRGMLMVIAGGLALSGGLVFVFRRRLTALLDVLFADGQALIAESAAGWQSQWHETPRWLWALLLLFVSAGIGLRLIFITQPIRTDEAWTTYTYAIKPLYLALSDYSAPNNHLFHTFWVWLSIRLFGLDEWVVRLPAFISGVLLIPVTFVVMRALYDRHAGIIAAGLVAVSSPLIEYSTNARGYTLQTLLVLLAILLAYHTLMNRDNVLRWLLMALVSALAIYTIPTGVYAVGGVWLWVLLGLWLREERESLSLILRRVLGYGTLSILMIVTLYTPVLVVTGLRSITGNTYVSGLEFSVFLENIVYMVQITLAQWHTDIPLPLVLMLGVGLLLSLILHRRIADYPVPLALPLLLSIVVLLLIQQVAPFRRVWLFLLPLYFGMAGVGWLALVTSRTRWQLGIVGVAAIAIIVIGVAVSLTRSPYTSIETGTFRDAEAVMLDLALLSQRDGRIIYEHPSGEPMTFYAVQHSIERVSLSRWGLQDVTPIYVVVNTEYPQTIESVLTANGLVRDAYDTAEQIGVYPQAAVYRLHRHDP